MSKDYGAHIVIAGKNVTFAQEHLKSGEIFLFSMKIVESVRLLIKALEVKHDVAVVTDDSVHQYFLDVKNEARFECDEKLLENLSRINTYYLESRTLGLNIADADRLFAEVKSASSLLLKMLND